MYHGRQAEPLRAVGGGQAVGSGEMCCLAMVPGQGLSPALDLRGLEGAAVRRFVRPEYKADYIALIYGLAYFGWLCLRTQGRLRRS